MHFQDEDVVMKRKDADVNAIVMNTKFVFESKMKCKGVEWNSMKI